MPYAIKTCGCEEPRPKPCRDDLFCPQCGGSVAWIDSDHLLPDPSGDGRPVLWVYRGGDDDHSSYELTLDFSELDALGEKRQRPLELTPGECRFSAPGFESRPEVVGVVGSRAVLRLVPSSADPLPAHGVRGRLNLSGNCAVAGQVLAGRPGTHDGIDVCVFNASDYAVIVEGDGVQRQPEARDAWQLWKDGPQELTLRIEPTQAPVFLARAGTKPTWPIENLDEVPARVTERPIVGASYGRGRAAVVVLELDPSSWEKQEARALPIRLDFALGQTCEAGLVLIRQAEGTLAWSTGNYLAIPPMFYGEKAETPPGSTLLPPIAVLNTAATPLRAQIPRVADGASLRGVRWIEAGWADGSEGVAELVQGKEKALRLIIDLSGVQPEVHAEGDPLKAEVVVKHNDFGMTWKLGVTIRSVGHRKPLEAPLAIDFGNTNSYASAELPGPRLSDPVAVRPLLGQADDPETFASALAFRDPNPAYPDYEIGHEALYLGRDRPLFLERGLKRDLSALQPVVDSRGEPLPVDDPAHEFNRRRFVYPREGRELATFSLRDLVRLYLTEVIARCEARERRAITQLGLSYPANLGPEPRRALDLVIRDLEREWKIRHPEKATAIAFRPLGMDEASAVALGFVLDPNTLRQRIIPMFRDGRASFALASFDFGGGSIDLALTQFDLEGLPPRTKFASTLLGIGGDESFGGDNVTVAAYEVLVSRLDLALGATQRPPLAPLDVHRNHVSLRDWTNRQALWDAAEVAKRAACRGEPHVARSEMMVAFERLHPDDAPARDAIGLEIEAGRLDLVAADLYTHTISRDLSGVGGYRVEDRLRACVHVLREFADRAGPDGTPAFLVLAGAGCRVPLARELLRSEFPGAVIVPDDGGIPHDYRPKSKVADGLARFLRASVGGEADPRVRGLKPANRYNHADLIWINPLFRDLPVVWARSCVELGDGAWHILEGIPLGAAWSHREPMAIDVHRRALPEPKLVGTARLDVPADLREDSVTPRLPSPPAELDEAQVLLRIDGEEDRLRIRVRLNNGEEFGDWRVRLAPGS